MTITALDDMIAGDSLIFDNTLSDNDAPVDLTGADIWFTAKRNKWDTDEQAIFQASTGNGQITITDAPAGAFTINVPATSTADLLFCGVDDFIAASADIEIEYADGSIRTTLFSLNIYRDVTRIS